MLSSKNLVQEVLINQIQSHTWTQIILTTSSLLVDLLERHLFKDSWLMLTLLEHSTRLFWDSSYNSKICKLKIMNSISRWNGWKIIQLMLTCSLLVISMIILEIKSRKKLFQEEKPLLLMNKTKKVFLYIFRIYRKVLFGKNERWLFFPNQQIPLRILLNNTSIVHIFLWG